jgi:2'-5' RNA ligase
MGNQWSIWLCPDPSDQSSIQQLVDECCYRFKYPSFASHITLFGKVDVDPVTTFSFLADCVFGLDSISLNMLGVKTGTPPWKALYLQVDKTEPLARLQKEIDQYLNVYRHYEFNPHLSLAYGNLEINESKLENISFPETITFSSVVLMETPDDINEWKLIFQADLIGGKVL